MNHANLLLEKEVILLDKKGDAIALAAIRSYEPSTKLYKINYRLSEGIFTIVENVLEERLRNLHYNPTTV